MPKKLRVHELAKTVNVPTKELMEKLKDFNVEVASHMSSVEDEIANKVIAFYNNKNGKDNKEVKENKEVREVKESRDVKETKEAKEVKEVKEVKEHKDVKDNRGEKKEEKKAEVKNNNANSNAKPMPKKENNSRPAGKPERRPAERTEKRRPERAENGSGNQNRQGNNRPGSNQNRNNNNNRNDNRGDRNEGRGGRPFRGQDHQQGGNQRDNRNNQRNNQRNDRLKNAGGPTDRIERNDKSERVERRNESFRDKVEKPERPERNKFSKNDRNDDNRRNNNQFGKKNNQKNGKPSKKDNKGKEKEVKKAPPKPAPEPKEDQIKIVEIPETITVKEFADLIGKGSTEVIKALMMKGVMLGINQSMDFDLASSIGEGFNVIVEHEVEKDVFEEAFGADDNDREEDLEPRPPVVVVMGHVDHGKTSLLDAIRHSSVTATEAGGITQHIGAYTVEIDGNPITFLDTPGHEAFTAMRLRGALVTDIAVLVVAADDGVMPQTIEAINHAKAAGVEIIVAINKIDKPAANPDRVKQELTEYGLLAEDWGGTTICVPVSAVTKQGLDDLLEMIILSAEMKELKANPNKKARGTVIEAQLDKGRGPVATVLVQNGTLNVGDPVVIGTSYGRVRAMMDDKGRRVKKAGPSKPVEILGLSEVPAAGDSFYVAESDKQARQLAESVVAKERVEMTKKATVKVSLDDLFNQIQAGNIKELNIVVKADVQGSVEAVRSSLERLSNEEVRINIIHGAVGTITESDIMLASASNAIIIGFNVRPEPAAKAFADEEKVDVRLYRVIYNAIEDITAAMKGMLDPVYEEQVVGHAEVRQTFKASGIGTIAGCYVQDGKFQRSNQVRLIRDGIVVYEGEMESLRRFKDDVKEVNAGYECGIVLKKFNDIKVEDIIEGFTMVEIPR